MRPPSEPRREEVYARAHKSLRNAAALTAPVFAAAATGLVVVLDVAGMGEVNARHGVTTGDRLLLALEISLGSALDGTGLVVRLAGDQFLILVPGNVHVDSVVGDILRAVGRTRVRGRWCRSVKVQVHLGVAKWLDGNSRRLAIPAAGKALWESRARSARTEAMVRGDSSSSTLTGLEVQGGVVECAADSEHA